MTEILTWRHLSEADTRALRQPDEHGRIPRGAVAFAMGISQPCDERKAIEVDLYVMALKFSLAVHMEDDQLSTLLSLVKVVHEESVASRLTMEASFGFFKHYLLVHTVQRPPFSVGLYSVKLMSAIIDWMLETYYRQGFITLLSVCLFSSCANALAAIGKSFSSGHLGHFADWAAFKNNLLPAYLADGNIMLTSTVQ